MHIQMHKASEKTLKNATGYESSNSFWIIAEKGIKASKGGIECGNGCAL